MKKEEIRNTELERIIAMKTGKINFSEVTDEDLSKITEMNLNAYLINGKESGITLEDALLFPNLQTLTISNYRITQELLKLLGELKGLERLHFNNILFEGDIDFQNLLERLRKVSFINCGDLNFGYPAVDQIQVERSNIDFEKIQFSQVKRISIQDSNIKNAFGLEEYDIESVNLDGTTLYDKNGNIVEDIEVGKSTVYTHQKEVYKYDRGME